MADAVQGFAGVPRFEADDDSVRVVWPDGHESRFLYYWLRENCHCSRCTHPDAWERTLDFLSIPIDIAPSSLTGDAAGLRIEWPAHEAVCEGSFYSWTWLDAHRAEREARLARKRRPTSWQADDFSKASVAVDFSRVMETDGGLLELLEHVENTGVALATGVPADEGAVLTLAQRIAFVEESHFGRYFQVESKPHAENLAYTPNALRPHNDLASRRYPPGIQFLHCLQNDVTGGDSVLVDAIACAEALRVTDPCAFDILANCQVTFASRSPDWHIVNRATIIDVDEDGDIVGTRLHPALLGPVDVEPDAQLDFYRAHRELLSIASSAEMQYRFRLEAGECQVFDNRRILHARSSYDPASGHRMLQGCYVCRDDLMSRLAVLRREGREFREI